MFIITVSPFSIAQYGTIQRSPGERLDCNSATATRESMREDAKQLLEAKAE
jgi:hypothetical protein